MVGIVLATLLSIRRFKVLEVQVVDPPSLDVGHSVDFPYPDAEVYGPPTANHHPILFTSSR
jgi:hypothetical protein